jgi:3-hydroxyacyl-CoA dehydrogenase
VADVKRIGVVGLGAMGAGIAQLAIEAGYETVGREVEARAPTRRASASGTS